MASMSNNSCCRVKNFLWDEEESNPATLRVPIKIFGTPTTGDRQQLPLVLQEQKCLHSSIVWKGNEMLLLVGQLRLLVFQKSLLEGSKTCPK